MFNSTALKRFIYALAIATLLACFVMSVLLVKRALLPYYAIRELPDRMRAGTLTHFKTDRTSTQISSYIAQVHADITHNKYSDALVPLDKARQLDPGNGLFDYLRAVVHFKKGKTKQMWQCIQSGNDADHIQLHDSGDIMYDAWLHPELPAVRQMVSTLTRKETRQDRLWELLRFGDNLVKMQPANMNRVYTGMGVRDLAAKKLSKIAEANDDQHLYAICQALIREKFEINRYDYSDGFRSTKPSEYPAMFIILLSYRRSPEIRQSLWLYSEEQHVEYASRLIGEVSKVKLGRTPETTAKVPLSPRRQRRP